MANNDAFLFVNAGGPSRVGHKVSTTARAFVMRKARAERFWSSRHGQLPQEGDTSRVELINQQQGNLTTNDGRFSRNDSRRKHGFRGMEMILQEEMAIFRPNTPDKLPTEYRSASALGGQQVNTRFGPTQTVNNIKTHTELDGLLDPFRTSPVNIDKQNSVLLDFCRCFYHKICAAVIPAPWAIQV
jgi:hypothetical protein